MATNDLSTCSPRITLIESNETYCNLEVLKFSAWDSTSYACPSDIVGSEYVACASSTCFFTNPQTKQIVVLDSSINVIGTFGNDTLVAPSGLAVIRTSTTTYEVYVVDTGANGVWHFTWNTGNTVSATTKVIDFGTTTFTSGVIAVLPASLLVAFVGDTHVGAYTLAGTSTGNFGLSFTSVQSVLVDYGNNVIVYDSGTHSAYVHSPSGTLTETFGVFEGTLGITVTRNYLYYISFSNGLLRSISTVTPTVSQTNITCVSQKGSIRVFNISGGSAPYTYKLFPNRQYNDSNPTGEIVYSGLSGFGKSSAIAVYSEGFQDGYFDSSWGTHINPLTPSSVFQAHSGNYSYSFSWNAGEDYTGYGFGWNGGIYPKQHYAVQLWLNVGEGGQTFTIRVSNNTASLDSVLEIKPGPNIPNNTWFQVTVPIYNAIVSNFTNLYFESESGVTDTNTVYVDDVTFIPFPWDYMVEVDDFCGSSSSKIVNFRSENLMEVQVATKTTSCIGASDGALFASINGGSAPYSYSWQIAGTTTNGTDRLENLPNFGSNMILYENGLAIGWRLSGSQVDWNGTDSTYFKTPPNSISFSASPQRYPTLSLLGGSNGLDGAKYMALEFWVNGGPTGGQNLQIAVTKGGNVGNKQFLNDLTGVSSLPANVWLQVRYDLTPLEGVAYDGIQLILAEQQTTQTIYIDDVVLISLVEGPKYTLTVTDNTGCQAVNYVQVSTPAPITSVVTTSKATCYGSSDGVLFVNPSGGTAPYHLKWNSSTISNTTISNLPASFIDVEVFDAHDCPAPFDASAYILQPAALGLATISIAYPKCYGSPVSISLTAAGGVSPYNFAWSSIVNTSITKVPQAAPTVIFADELQPGFSALLNNKTLNFTCSKLPIMPYSGYCALQIAATQFDSLLLGCPSCISLGKNTGIGFQIYLEDASDAFRIKTNLILQGIYIFDDLPIYNASSFAKNGSAVQSETWFEVFYSFAGFPNIKVDHFAIFANWTTTGAVYIDNIILYVDSETSTTLANGVSVPEGFNSIISGPAGSYTLNLTDGNNCAFIHTFPILQPDALTLSSVIKKPSSSSAADGSITVTAAGGTPPYKYLWIESNTAKPVLSGVAYATYAIRIEDANGCILDESVSVPIGVTVRKYNAALSGGLGVIVGIGAIIALFAVFMLALYWDSFSTLGSFYSSVLLFGVLVSYAAAIVLLPRPTDALCTAFPWLLGIAFILVYGCLFIKTWALYQVWTAAKQYQRTSLNAFYIVKILGAALLVEIVFLIIWTCIDPPKVHKMKSVDNTQELQCNTNHPTFWIIFLSVKGVWLILGAVLSVLTRDVVKRYNESTAIAYAIYNIVVLCCIAVPLGILLEEVPGGRLVIEVVITVLAFTFTMCIMFFKAWYTTLLSDGKTIVPPTTARSPSTSKLSDSRKGSVGSRNSHNSRNSRSNSHSNSHSGSHEREDSESSSGPPVPTTKTVELVAL